MWQALKNIAESVKESLGIEVPTGPAVVTDAAAGAADQAGEAATTAAAGVAEQISGKVSDFLGRLGG